MANGLGARVAKMEQASEPPGAVVLWRREHRNETDEQVLARWRTLNSGTPQPERFEIRVIQRVFVGRPRPAVAAFGVGATSARYKNGSAGLALHEGVG